MFQKKAISLFIALLLLSTPTFSQTFSDINQLPWAQSAIENLYLNGFINGYPDGTFKPSGTISRAEVVKIFNRINDFSEETDKVFTDVNSSHWAYKEIRIAVKAGIIQGFPDGSFRPDTPITREQLAVMINNLYHLENKVMSKPLKDLSSLSSWAVQAVINVLSNDLMRLNNDGSFGGKSNALRADSAFALNNVVIKELITKSEYATNPLTVPKPPTVDNGNNTGATGSTPVVNLSATAFRVVDRLSNSVKPLMITEKQIQITNLLIDAIGSYANDLSYNPDLKIAEVNTIKETMIKDEKEYMSEVIIANVAGIDLIHLNEVFKLVDLSKYYK